MCASGNAMDVNAKFTYTRTQSVHPEGREYVFSQLPATAEIYALVF